MEHRLDTISADINEIKISLARLDVSMTEHMRRSKANEEAIDVIRKEQFKMLLTVVGALGAVLLEIWIKK
jgi:hypothetical protein